MTLSRPLFYLAMLKNVGSCVHAASEDKQQDSLTEHFINILLFNYS